jgi:hypothetical protein
MIPVGIVAVERAQPGMAAEARVLAKFGEILIGHELVPLNTTVPPASARAAALPNGPTARVVWISGEPELPTPQFHVVIDAGAGAGLRQGDQITFYRPARTLPSGVVLPESDIGIAQVVRVGERTSTAIIIQQSQAAIRVDTPARVTAKMP